jgi:hypothetical protein
LLSGIVRRSISLFPIFISQHQIISFVIFLTELSYKWLA